MSAPEYDSRGVVLVELGNRVSRRRANKMADTALSQTTAVKPLNGRETFYAQSVGPHGGGGRLRCGAVRWLRDTRGSDRNNGDGQRNNAVG